MLKSLQKTTEQSAPNTSALQYFFKQGAVYDASGPLKIPTHLCVVCKHALASKVFRHGTCRPDVGTMPCYKMV